jgi:hypothetical protein
MLNKHSDLPGKFYQLAVSSYQLSIADNKSIRATVIDGKASEQLFLCE